MTPCGFRKLVCQAQAGHGPSIDRLFSLTRPLVMRAVESDPARVPRPDTSGEDLSQDVFLRVFRKLKHFKGTGNNVPEASREQSEADVDADDELAWKLYRSWLRKTARRIVLNDRKRQQRRQTLAPQ